MSNVDRWSDYYDGVEEPQRYGDDDNSYLMAEEWLDGLNIEDWGCGLGWFKTIHYGGYIGVDGTWSRWCDVHADLTDYRSRTPGLLMRHVLEHNYKWRDILDNAVASFTQRMVLILFTPLVAETKVLTENAWGIGVPDIAFNLKDILDRIPAPCLHDVESINSNTQYGVETIIRLEK
jgi:hypothetical protein